MWGKGFRIFLTALTELPSGLVSCFVFRFQDLGYPVQGFGFRVLGPWNFRVQGFGVLVYHFGFRTCRREDPGLRVQV
jgi:hypothetical protein